MWNFVYLYIFFVSFVLSLLLTSLFRKLALKWSFLDNPEERKLHLEAKPLLGGAAIYLAFVLNIIINLAIVALLHRSPQLMNLLPEDIAGRLMGVMATKSRLLAILSGGTIIFLLGLWDDRRGGISPYVKLGGQLLAALLLVLFGIKITMFLPSWLAIIITIIWVVGMTNAFNLLDNMDGLAAGVALIAALIFFLVALQQGQLFVSVILLIFAGSLTGFLPYNFRPATIFMGDAGSMFIGFILATLTVLNTFYTQDSPTFLPVVMPLLILGVPIFDTLSVIFLRRKKGASIFVADKRHFSHRLIGLGMSHKQAVIFIYLVAFSVGINATLLRGAKLMGAIVILVQALVIFSLIVFLEVIAGRGNKVKIEGTKIQRHKGTETQSDKMRSTKFETNSKF
ncbi:MAG: undecaprenyl/decaprenyl-phosphate alpha-N-acetylglucosaminyl 1-phosphate transferase [Nitrospirae bacterium]|nr:undecaprenyl/decaprenyl-phosphate alpha-N-acetylglucosaminyl 1-phosphate transferase [Nitrospirota bacterium]